MSSEDSTAYPSNDGATSYPDESFIHCISHQSVLFTLILRTTHLLCLDWITSSTSIVVGLSDGSASVVSCTDSNLETVQEWKGHDFELWTASLDPTILILSILDQMIASLAVGISEIVQPTTGFSKLKKCMQWVFAAFPQAQVILAL